jgi:hypothetical protein
LRLPPAPLEAFFDEYAGVLTTGFARTPALAPRADA